MYSYLLKNAIIIYNFIFLYLSNTFNLVQKLLVSSPYALSLYNLSETSRKKQKTFLFYACLREFLYIL